jgi:hypothetical protein
MNTGSVRNWAGDGDDKSATFWWPWRGFLDSVRSSEARICQTRVSVAFKAIGEQLCLRFSFLSSRMALRSSM